MNQALFLVSCLFFTLVSFAQAPAPSVHAIPGIENSTVEVRFTNPDCAAHKYQIPVRSQSGVLLEEKKKGAYCTFSDYINTSSWTHSPQAKLIEWINDPQTKEVFFAFLSGSNKAVARALCKAIKSKGLKVTYVLDTSSDLSVVNEYLHQLNCSVDSEVAHEPAQLVSRGNALGEGDDKIGWAHNKIFMVNPNDPERLKFTASSGNLSSGAIMHHENWLFFDVSKKSYLAQSHLCLMKSQLDDSAHLNKYVYADKNGECLRRARQNYRPENEGVRPFFIPGEGPTAINKYLMRSIKKAKKVTVAAHRLGMGKIVRGLREAAGEGKDVKMMVDDDIYWLLSLGLRVGDNMQFEANNIKSIEDRGAQIKFLETNNFSHLLHHNKILLFEKMDGQQDAVWTGAGNLTSAAFYTNFENFYYITIPGVVEAYKNQLEYAWKDLASSYKDMPVENVQSVDDN